MKLKALLSIFLIITFLPAIGYAADEDRPGREEGYSADELGRPPLPYRRYG